MKQYKIVYKLNGRWCFFVFNYNTEEEMKDKRQEWKTRTITPYNKVEIIWFGDNEDYDYGSYREIKQDFD